MLKKLISVSGFTLLSRITGFARDALLAWTLGAGLLSDAFFVAFLFPNYFRAIFGEGTINPAFLPPSAGAPQYVFVHTPVNQFLQTLLITTSYYSGQVTPSLTLLYDWGGAVAVIPSLVLSRDPFRFAISYDYLFASTLKGGSGVSLLRDRDNVLFQVEYVL